MSEEIGKLLGQTVDIKLRNIENNITGYVYAFVKNILIGKNKNLTGSA
jgi:ribosomal protein S17E